MICRPRIAAMRWVLSGATKSRDRDGFVSFISVMRILLARQVVAADAEICAMLSDTLEAVGIARGDYVCA